MASSLKEWLPGIGVSLEFGEIAPPKLIPLCWIVTEPFPQFGARRNIFEPALNLERALLHSPWPQSLDQESCAICAALGIVCSLQLNDFKLR